MVMRRIQLTDIFERRGEYRAAYLLKRPRATARAYDRLWKQALSRHNLVCQKLAFVMAAWRKALIECPEGEWHSDRLLLAGSVRSATEALEHSTSRNLGLADRQPHGKLTDRMGREHPVATGSFQVSKCHRPPSGDEFEEIAVASRP